MPQVSRRLIALSPLLATPIQTIRLPILRLAVVLLLVGLGILRLSGFAASQSELAASGAVFTVNTTGDGSDAVAGDGVCDTGNGDCSLRAALMEANALVGTDSIAFNLSGSSPFVISLQSELPEVTDPIILDGATQPGYTDTPIVVLDGGSAGPLARGLVISAGASTVSALGFSHFAGNAIRLTEKGGNRIIGNGIDQNGYSSCGLVSSDVVDLGTAFVKDINDCGEVVGTRIVPETGATVGFLWLPRPAYELSAGFHNLTELGGIPQAINIEAINNRGEFAGHLRGSDNKNHLFLWLPNAAYGLPAGFSELLDVDCLLGCVVADMNDQGQIVGRVDAKHWRWGSSGSLKYEYHGFLWAEGNFIQLPSLADKYEYSTVSWFAEWYNFYWHPFQSSQARSINEKGEIVGLASCGSQIKPDGSGELHREHQIVTCQRAVRWTADGGGPIDLGFVGAYQKELGAFHNGDTGPDLLTVESSAAYGINNRSQIAGNSTVIATIPHPIPTGYIQTYAGVLWSPGMTSLDRFTPDAINDLGQLIGDHDNRRGVPYLRQTDGSERALIQLIPGAVDEGLLNNRGDVVGIRSCPKPSGGSTRCSLIWPGSLINPMGGGDSSGIAIVDSPDNLIGGTIPEERNVVLGSKGPGITIVGNEAIGNQIMGNYVGVAADGSSAVANQGDGVAVDGAPQTQIGSIQAGGRNVIAGNGGNGISIQGTTALSVTVQGNYVGVDAAGTAALPNQLDGILVLETSGVFIGGAAGVSAGGPCTGSCNLVSGNRGDGIKILSGSQAYLQTRVEGNFIGADVTGMLALPNRDGIWIDNAGGNRIGWKDSAAQANLISGNRSHGIRLTQAGATDNIVLGNHIGVDATGAEKLGNTFDGIRVEDASDNVLGLTVALGGNTVAGNGGNGVSVVGSTAISNTIRGNSLFANGRLAIDLGDDGVTPNDLGDDPATVDSDDGPNRLLNFPAGVTKYSANGATTISGLVDDPQPLSTVVDVYEMIEVDTSGFGSGRVYLGSATPDAQGLFRLVLVIPVDGFVSATLTDGGGSGSTSEFSAVCGDPDGDGNPDTDGDGLCDDWEKNGIDYDGNGSVDLDLVSSFEDKDIFVEIDYMVALTHTHRPNPDALTDVESAFAAAPVSNPSGVDGINLYAIEDEFLQERPQIYFLSRQPAADDDFYDIKIGSNDPAKPGTPCGIGYNDGHFGSPVDRLSPNCLAILGAKRLVYRYALYGHQVLCVGDPICTGISGIGDLPGDDFMVTFGDWPGPVVNRTSEGGTLMHELGHTLNLLHGGADNIHNKPNFMSIMNYSFQLGQIIPRPLDYSRWALSSLNEAALQEQKGIDNNAPPADLAARWPQTIYSFYDTTTDSCRWAATPTVGAIDWNNSGAIQGGVIGPVGINNPQKAASNPAGLEGCQTSSAEVLSSANDWARIQYNQRASADYGPPSSQSARAESSPDELTYAQSVAQAELIDADGDGLSNAQDNCPFTPNPGQADTNGDGIGDACSLAAVSFNPSPLSIGSSLIGTVRLAENAPPSGASVRLYSRSPHVLTLPAHVKLPAGTLSLSFPVTPTQVTVSTPVTVALYYEGSAHTITATVMVKEGPSEWELYLPTITAP